jgi:hypothetical protein
MTHSAECLSYQKFSRSRKVFVRLAFDFCRHSAGTSFGSLLSLHLGLEPGLPAPINTNIMLIESLALVYARIAAGTSHQDTSSWT